MPDDGGASRATGWRKHEALGIVVLACALLAGPSLASVQFGTGRLMGPFGELVGRGVNWAMGLAGYALAAWLGLVALRIFQRALGRPLSSPGRLRQRIGMLLTLAFVPALLHLMSRPRTLSGASYGGALGELVAEVLRAVLSTPGAWIICVAGLATGLVLGTSLSWTRGAVSLFRAGARTLARFWQSIGRLRPRLAALVAFLGQQLAQHRNSSLSPDGSAAMPPVLRLDLEGVLPRVAESMPIDLEVGRRSDPCASETTKEPSSPPAGGPAPVAPERAAPSPAPGIEHAALLGPEILVADLGDPAHAASVAAPEGSAVGAAAPRKGKPRGSSTGRAAEAPAEELEALTIVEATFDKHRDVPEESPQEQRVEPTDGPGFLLFSETYRAPPLSLLEMHDGEHAAVDRDAIRVQAERLVSTLGDYKITGRVTNVHPGPVVTMYEFVPAPGTRISRVANLANDLAMSLKAQRVRIVAPIPGKGAIGIEVPNEQREIVSYKQIVADDAFRSQKTKLALALGKNIFGAPVAMDLARMPHLLVAGATGAGKSVCINAMICSLLLRSTPEEVRMIMVDPKFLELSGYNEIPHLLLPVVTDPKQANVALRWAVNEMERRYQLLAELRVRDIGAYNRKVAKLRGERSDPEQVKPPASGTTMEEARPSKVLIVRKRADGSEEPLAGAIPPSPEGAVPAAGDEHRRPAPSSAVATAAQRRGSRDPQTLRRLPYIVVIIDEFADLMMIAPKEVESSVARLAQKARAAGIHLIVATQRPSVDVITGLIKANFPSRIAFQVASTHDSKTILGCHGAENLLGAGDMLVLDRGTEMKRVHGAFIADAEIKRIADWLREQGKPVYDMNILKPPDEEEQAASANDDAPDELYDQAVAIVTDTRQVSISMIQRRLRIGYNRSARIVERMEREGIVGPPDGVRGREVLVSPT